MYSSTEWLMSSGNAKDGHLGDDDGLYSVRHVVVNISIVYVNLVNSKRCKIFQILGYV